MKLFRRILLLTIAVVALILLFATTVLWIHGRRHIDYVDFTRFDRSFRVESDSRNGLYLSVTYLTPTIGARVTGMTATPNGWAAPPGQPIMFQITNLPTGTPSSAPSQVQGNPLAISRMRLQFHGFDWSSGFTTQHAVLPGPFPACQVDTFTLTYTTAAVVLTLTTLIAGYFYKRASRKYPEGFCQSCGYDLRATSGQCPECGTPVKATV